MNLKNTFKIDAIISLINGLGLLFATSMFFEMAQLTMSASLLTIGQFMGVTFLFLAILFWRTPDIAGSATNNFARIYALGHLLWFLIIGYHIITSQVAGPTAYGNIIVTGLIAILYFKYSKD